MTSVTFALVLNLVAVLAAYRLGLVTWSGAAAGAVIGILVFAGLGGAGWAMLVIAFSTASLATRVGHARKTGLGIAEENQGRRRAANAIGNTGVAAIAACVALHPEMTFAARVAFVAALVTSASDTVASEIGKAWGGVPRLVVSFARVPPGTTGAVSIVGTTAGVVSACLLAIASVGLDLAGLAAVLPIVAAATLAAVIESVLGATVEAAGLLDNHAINFINSLVGAFLAVVFAAL